jgi:glycerol-3-phosphate acyltransferase PlsY
VIIAIKFTVIALVAYLLGSIPFGLIFGRAIAHVDIRKYGSGNIGATNVLRTLGLKAGIPTLIMDLAKAALTVWVGMLVIGDESLVMYGLDVHVQAAQAVSALMAVVGHNWSIYLKFKGGKGVATFIGGLLVINPIVAIIGAGIGIVVVLATRYVSLGSILGSLAVLVIIGALTALALVAPVYLVYILVAVAIIVYQHRANIQRLQAGKELKLGDKSARLDK